MKTSYKTSQFVRFLIIFISTIIFYRILVLIFQDTSLYIAGYEIHHLYVGVLLVIIAGFSRFFSKSKKLNRIDLVVFAIGTGMIVDELLFLLFTEGRHIDYFSAISFLGAIIFAAILTTIFYIIFREETNVKK